MRQGLHVMFTQINKESEARWCLFDGNNLIYHSKDFEKICDLRDEYTRRRAASAETIKARESYYHQTWPLDGLRRLLAR